MRIANKVVVNVANLEGELSMEVNGERIPLVAAFEPKDVPVLKLGRALPQYKALHAG